MVDYEKKYCNKCVHKDVSETKEPCKECIDKFFGDWRNPNRSFIHFKKGGSHNYIYSRLSQECEGEMHDAEMDDLIKDLCEVLHDLEWWQSGDYSEDQYRETVSEFKKKWLKNELMKLIDKTYEDFKNAPGGEAWCEIDGKEYQSDMGYALEGIDMFVDVLKSRIRRPGIMSECCPWYDMCIYKTATCRVRYPDNGCVLYRWFKELINKEGDEDESNNNDN